MPAIPVERIREVLIALESYEADDYEVDLSKLPEWPNEPEKNTPAWVAMQILRETASDEPDDIAVYDGYAGARSALQYIIGMAESPPSTPAP